MTIHPSRLALSIILPVNNEADIINDTLLQIRAKFTSPKLKSIKAYLVENGSRDNSVQIIRELESKQAFYPELEIKSFVENSAGLGTLMQEV